MSDVNIKALEKQHKVNEKAMRLGDAVKRLMNNRDFKTLILDEFCTQECARYVHASANPALNEASQRDALNMAQAAGHFRRFLEVTMQKANAAEDANSSIESILARIDAGEALSDIMAEQQADDEDELY